MPWIDFPHHEDAYVRDAAGLQRDWARLHAGDCEPFPVRDVLVEAWIAYHAGDFQRAKKLGLTVGLDGYAVAHKASCTYASYLETNEKRKFDLFEEVAERCDRQQAEQPDNPAAWYWQALALGRYSQGVSVVKALTHGIAPKVRAGFERAIALAPAHADAHIGLGVFHGEIIANVGTLIGGLTYGARKEECYRAFHEALRLNPASPNAHIEYANALLKLEGKKKMEEAVALYRQAAALVPADAKERLEVELAKEQLEDE
jgi:tetratricopeptide (TPR) repeat protein